MLPEPALIAAQRPEPAAFVVPDRPALATNVELIGELRDSGFEDRQWLIRRDGRFIQVTELLYRVAEHADGTHTLEDIAASVTAATAWIVSADDVRRLLEVKLIPLALVAPANPSVTRPAPDRRRSSLQIRLRRPLLGPGSLDRITRVLQVLYAPPLLVPLVLLIAIAHGWVYLVHGVAVGVRAALYTPGGLLIVLAIAVAAGIFHELGHAAALHYGGGRARGMGVGLYLVYPTFYTDVTDAYRLGRWARLRTDLGGIYFHLVFALGLIGLYAVSGREVLLAVLMVIAADIFYQLVPYVRLDGYWALADVTGIPDFFSQTGAFLRSLRPLPASAGQRLPRLKPWVSRVFAVYLALTVPVLALLFVLMVRGIPRFVTLGWDALFYQARVFAIAHARGDVLLMAAVASQLVLLALAMLAVVYVLYGVSHAPIRALWNWSVPTPARRLAGALIAVTVVGLVALLWAPVLRFPQPSVPAGVQGFEVTERSHVEGPVSYPLNPPVGGNHAPLWQNCGFYEEPVGSAHAVHSLEHGAVWIAYRPGLPLNEIARLRRVAHQHTYVLVSPIPELTAPVVASAWGHQLRLDSTADPRLEAFLGAFRLGPGAPERGGPCSGGIGEPG